MGESIKWELPLRSTYDRVFLYRCVAQNVSPKPKLLAQPGLLAIERRRTIRDRLLAFYEKNISANAATENAATLKWRMGLDERLGL